MNCPVCNKSLAPTLSICPSCGAMMNDSVREELKDKIISAPKPLKLEVKPGLPPIEKSETPIMYKPKTQIVQNPPVIETPAPQPPPAPVKTTTTEIAAKPTSPTLVDFQNKNAVLPDWRLQVQNAVRKRVESAQKVGVVETTAIASNTTVKSVHLPTSGANALKAEFIEEPAPVVAKSNSPLEGALRRIEESRKRFLPEEPKEEIAPKPPVAANKNYPFYIATKNAEILPKPAEIKASAPVANVPRLEDLPVIEKKAFEPAVAEKKAFEDLPVVEKKGFDTNKLKPLPNAAIISSHLEKVSGELPPIDEVLAEAPRISISRVQTEFEEEDDFLEIDSAETLQTESEDEIEDLAPIALRFNSGVFDLLIGAFASLILLAPFMLTKGNWFSFPGFLAFLVTTAIVMFIYLTTAIGMFGKTAGMKIFSLETIDIEENDYPTFHQAAVSSSVYLVSLALGGIGFLPALFNSERRTAPDLLSGTIVVKEY